MIVGALSEEELTELFYVREALEGMAARLAAENATPSEMAEIRELLEDMEAVRRRGDVEALRRLTGEFHQMVCRASHNHRLLQSLQALLDTVRQIKTSTLYGEGRPAEALKGHRNLLRAIEMRDGDRAEKLAREHRRTTLICARRCCAHKCERAGRRASSGVERLRPISGAVARPFVQNQLRDQLIPVVRQHRQRVELDAFLVQLLGILG